MREHDVLCGLLELCWHTPHRVFENLGQKYSKYSQLLTNMVIVNTVRTNKYFYLKVSTSKNWIVIFYSHTSEFAVIEERTTRRKMGRTIKDNEKVDAVVITIVWYLIYFSLKKKSWVQTMIKVKVTYMYTFRW